MSRLVDFAHRKPALFLILLALALRLPAVLVLDLKGSTLKTNFDTPAAGEQAQMARGLLRGGDFTYFVVDGKPAPSAYQPPLYPTMLAGIFAVMGDKEAAFVVVQLLQCLLGALTALLTFRLARAFLVDRYALLAGFLVAVWPPLVYLPNEAHPISMLVPDLLWIGLTTVGVLRSKGRLKDFAGLAVALALGLMLRSELLLGLAVTAIVLLIQLRKQAAAGLAIVFVLALAVQIPWMLRNRSSLGKAALTTTTGVNLFRGNGPTATGGSYQWDGTIVWETPETMAAEKQLHWSADYELRLDQIYSDQLSASLKGDSLRPLRLLPMKFLFFWTSDFTHPKGKQPAAWVPWILVLPAVLYGMGLLWKRRRETWPLYLWTMLYLVIVLVFFALPRYRLNVEPMFLIFAAAGFAAFRERNTRGEIFSPVSTVLSTAGDNVA
jgi:4-amino-4-deoxy-L-arabinose transferase-like glycosyltransferase